jgi:hypothetical protein
MKIKMPNIIDKLHLVRRENQSYVSPYVYLGLAVGGVLLLFALIMGIGVYRRKQNQKELAVRPMIIPPYPSHVAPSGPQVPPYYSNVASSGPQIPPYHVTHYINENMVTQGLRN